MAAPAPVEARVQQGEWYAVSVSFVYFFCVLAQTGHRDPAEAQRAYLAGMQRILPRDHLPYLAREHGPLALDAVWAPLDQLDPLAKQALVEAATATIAHDGRMHVAEAELLRTLCGVLHCPLPPLPAGA